MSVAHNRMVRPHIAQSRPGGKVQTLLVLTSLASGPLAAALYAVAHPLPQAASLGLTVSASLMLATFMRSLAVSHSSHAHEHIHGSARWATRADIEAAGLLAKKGVDVAKGVYVGAWVDARKDTHYLRHNGPEHVLCYAPTRSGKGVGLVVPTLLSWPHSAVVLDLKGELWELTAGWRKANAGNRVLRFDPANPIASVKFNPLAEIRLGTAHEVGDVQNLATLIVDPDGKGLTTHWQKTAQGLLVGAILHLLYKSHAEGKSATLPALDALLSNPDHPVDEVWKEMTTYPHRNGAPHPVVAAVGRDMIDRPEVACFPAPSLICRSTATRWWRVISAVQIFVSGI